MEESNTPPGRASPSKTGEPETRAKGAGTRSWLVDNPGETTGGPEGEVTDSSGCNAALAGEGRGPLNPDLTADHHASTCPLMLRGFVPKSGASTGAGARVGSGDRVETDGDGAEGRAPGMEAARLCVSGMGSDGTRNPC